MTWRRFGVLLIVVALAAPAARAEPTAADAERIRAVIESQIEAFRRGDGIAAFGLASATIQRTFGSPEGFMAMVRNGYGALIDPRRLAFFEPEERRGVVIQRVLVERAAGGLILAVYPMVRHPDGTWRIDGCALREVPGDET